MRNFVLTLARFLLFLFLGFHIIEPPVLLLSLEHRAITYLSTTADMSLQEINSDHVLNKTDPGTYKEIFGSMDIKADEDLEKKIGGHTLYIHYLVPEIEEPNLQDSNQMVSLFRRSYRAAASFPEPEDMTLYTSNAFFYPYIVHAWSSGEPDEYRSSGQGSIVRFIPIKEEGTVAGLIMIESNAWNLGSLLESGWRAYRLKLVLLVPALLLLFIILEFMLIGKADMAEFLKQVEKNPRDRWYPPWLMLLGKNYGVIILFLLVYPMLGYYVITMNELDFGPGLHILFLTLIGLPLFLPISVMLIIPGIQYRRLFRNGSLGLSVFRGTEKLKVYTRRGIREKLMYVFTYKCNGRIHELKMSPSELKKPGEKNEYFILFQPDRPGKAVLVELILKW
jgi:hypothetical protein